MAVLQLAVVSLAALIFNSANAVALAYCSTRIVQLAAIQFALKTTLGTLPYASATNALHLLKRSTELCAGFCTRKFIRAHRQPNPSCLRGR